MGKPCTISFLSIDVKSIPIPVKSQKRSFLKMNFDSIPLPLLLGPIFLALGTALAFRNWRRSKTWSSTKATAQLRGIEISKWHDETDVHQRVRYWYADANGRHHSLDIRDNVGSRKAGEQARVFYDPNNPKKSILGTAKDMYGGASAFICFGLMCIGFAYLSLR
jgi:hypothetical protein